MGWSSDDDVKSELTLTVAMKQMRGEGKEGFSRRQHFKSLV